MPLSVKSARLSLQAADLLIIAAALWAGEMLELDLIGVFGQLAIFMVLWILAAQRFGVYRDGRDLRWRVTSVTETWVVTLGVGYLASGATLETLELNVPVALGGGLAGMVGIRALAWPLLRSASQKGPRFLLVGACPSLEGITADLRTSRTLDVVGVVRLPGEEGNRVTDLEEVGTLGNLPQVILTNRVDSLVLCPSDKALTKDVQEVFSLCDQAGINVHYYPSFLDLQSLRVTLTWNQDRPGLSLNTAPNVSAGMIIKRTMDILGAAAGIALALPIMLFAAVGIWLQDRGPILFRQVRVGRNGQPFTCFKFRTMWVDADKRKAELEEANEQDGPAFKIRNDPRITPMGRLLRKYSLDELPQLFNVLIGDMSLVGPRPPIPSEVQQYDWWQRRRISVRPGLTCIWQVWGRNSVTFKRWVEMDLYYIDNWSLWMDVKLIAHTFRCVLSGTGM